MLLSEAFCQGMHCLQTTHLQGLSTNMENRTYQKLFQTQSLIALCLVGKISAPTTRPGKKKQNEGAAMFFVYIDQMCKLYLLTLKALAKMHLKMPSAQVVRTIS